MDTIIKEFPSFANKVFLIEKDGKLVVKKEFLVLDEKQIRISQAVRQQLKNIIHVPQFLKTEDGDTLSKENGIFFELSEYIPNTPIQRDSVLMYQCITTIGKMLAKIHTFPKSKLKAQNSKVIKLQTVDYKKINQEVQARIETFLVTYKKILHAAPPDLHQKLKVVKEFIDHTENQRKKILRENLSFYSAEKVLTHGDISLRNFLIPADSHSELFEPEPQSRRLDSESGSRIKSGMTLIDWDNMALNSPMFELQRSIGTICGAGIMNGNLEKIDFEKAKILLCAYQKIYRFNKVQILQLLEVAQYCYLIFWLHFTLQQVLKNDFRILGFVPDSLQDMLWWEKNMEAYRTFLGEII